MNLQEFAALKVGDKIRNHFSNSEGTVTAVLDQGIRLRWGDTPGEPEFTYVANSTAWFHWDAVARPNTKSAELAGETPEQEAERLTRNAT